MRSMRSMGNMGIMRNMCNIKYKDLKKQNAC